VILKYTDIHNACYILAEAAYLHATALIESLHGYIAANMETFLESRMLDDMPAHLIEQLAQYICRKQTEKSPVQRSNQLVATAMKNQSEWLALQDIPQPIIRASKAELKHSPKLSPSNPSRRLRHRPSTIGSPLDSPAIRAQTTPLGDDIFTMDEPDLLPHLSLEQTSPPSASADTVSIPVTAWKSSSTVPRCVVFVFRQLCRQSHLCI
jgi:inhibitor of Bruton tyrosine kinase